MDYIRTQALQAALTLNNHSNVVTLINNATQIEDWLKGKPEAQATNEPGCENPEYSGPGPTPEPKKCATDDAYPCTNPMSVAVDAVEQPDLVPGCGSEFSKNPMDATYPHLGTWDSGGVQSPPKDHYTACEGEVFKNGEPIAPANGGATQPAISETDAGALSTNVS